MRTHNLTTESQKKRRKVFRNGLNILCIIYVLVMISACGGGGGGGSSPVGPSTTIAFSGTSSPGSNTVYMAKNSLLSSGDTLAVDVKVNSVSDVRGAAFDLDFDSTKIAFTGYVEGDFFGAGSATLAELQMGSANKILVGVSRMSGTSSGSGTLVTLRFKAVAAGNTPISFSRNALTDSTGVPVLVSSWDGGMVTVQ